MKWLLCSAIPLFALAACATSKDSGPAAPPPAGPTAQRAAEKPSAAPANAAPSAGPTTASDAAERLHEEWMRTRGGRSEGAGGDVPRDAEDGPCSSDGDCALTRVAPGGCCETLCVPRAVTRTKADALRAEDRACMHGKICPDVSCHPLGQQGVEAKCEGGRCNARRMPGGGQ